MRVATRKSLDDLKCDAVLGLIPTHEVARPKKHRLQVVMHSRVIR